MLINQEGDAINICFCDKIRRLGKTTKVGNTQLMQYLN